MYAYVGSRTTRERNARGDGITVFHVETDATLRRVQVLGGLVNPSYLCLAHDKRTLYAVHGDQREVSSFSVDPTGGSLSLLNTQDTGGANPVHLALDPGGRFLLVSNHLGGDVVVLPIGRDGELAPVIQRVRMEGPIGPHRVEQRQAKPHFNAFAPGGRWVLVPDKGLDRVFGFEFVDGSLRPTAQQCIASREAAGPRHLAFHPTLPMVYVINELDATVTSLQLDASTGALIAVQRLSSLPESFTGDSRGAAIDIDAQGRCLYATNRGHDSIARFEIDPVSGRLRFADAVATGGRTPRAFALSPDGQALYALNEDSDNIVLFRRRATGKLEATGWSICCGSPVCMIFSNK